ncbi:MAG: YkvA family protein [Bacteroidales bacterium]
MTKMRNLTKKILVNSMNVNMSDGRVEANNPGELQHPVRRMIQSPWFTTILGVIYIISPIDLLPDVPVIGYLDDIFMGVIIGLNWAQVSTEHSNEMLSSVFKLIKWVMIILGIILFLLLSIFGLLIFNLFN